MVPGLTFEALQDVTDAPLKLHVRHCERSEAIQSCGEDWIASSP
jgi:hypothetical protein